MSAIGLVMLAAVALVIVGTGLPIFAALILVSVAGAVLGVALGAFDMNLLAALPTRIVALMESDILQALPLFVLMGALLHRLPLAAALYNVLARVLAPFGGAPLMAGFGLGLLLGPMNGSVGASVVALARTVDPKLAAANVDAPNRLAFAVVAGTLGVVVPPSLVLILLGDALQQAHTIALNASGGRGQIINTGDIFRGALVPATMFFALCLAIAAWQGRNLPRARPAPLRKGEVASALVTMLLVGGLLAGVALGQFYAVEAAAAGCMALLASGLAMRFLDRATLAGVLHETLAISGARFALLFAATTFTLLFRAFGSDRLATDFVLALPGSEIAVLAIVLALLFLCAIVLDAYECIFVVVPILMPALLMRVEDATWVAVLAILALQASFILPPLGYSVLMARGRIRAGVGTAQLSRALAPYLVAQALVFALVLAQPALVHGLSPHAPATLQGQGPARSAEPNVALPDEPAPLKLD